MKTCATTSHKYGRSAQNSPARPRPPGRRQATTAGVAADAGPAVPSRVVFVERPCLVSLIPQHSCVLTNGAATDPISPKSSRPLPTQTTMISAFRPRLETRCCRRFVADKDTEEHDTSSCHYMALPFESAMSPPEVTGQSADAQLTTGAIPDLLAAPDRRKCRTPPPRRRRRASRRRPERKNSAGEGAGLNTLYIQKVIYT